MLPGISLSSRSLLVPISTQNPLFKCNSFFAEISGRLHTTGVGETGGYRTKPGLGRESMLDSCLISAGVTQDMLLFVPSLPLGQPLIFSSPPTLCLMFPSAQPRPAHHLSMFLTHVKAHEQGPYNHHDNKDHHHNHDEKAFEMHGAAGDAELTPGTC